LLLAELAAKLGEKLQAGGFVFLLGVDSGDLLGGQVLAGVAVDPFHAFLAGPASANALARAKNNKPDGRAHPEGVAVRNDLIKTVTADNLIEGHGAILQKEVVPTRRGELRAGELS
jgi:hypothetical protein